MMKNIDFQRKMCYNIVIIKWLSKGTPFDNTTNKGVIKNYDVFKRTKRIY